MPALPVAAESAPGDLPLVEIDGNDLQSCALDEMVELGKPCGTEARLKAANNARLLVALEALREPFQLEHIPTRKRLDGGLSTAAEGALGIDLLFAAASRGFEDYRKHVVEMVVEGIPVKVLDIDGMILSKDTQRPEDIADRERLMRLKRRR